jgi:hypothetical protein
MIERKKTPCTKGKFTIETYSALENCNAVETEPMVGKEKNGRRGKKA